jgi:hypothetical protein
MTQTSTPPDTGRGDLSPGTSLLRDLAGRVTRLEIGVAAVISLVMLSSIVVEPEILEAPFENGRTLLFTFGGTALAAVAFIAMLWLRVPAAVRVVVLVVPFLLVNWWLISPYFTDDVVDEAFSASISDQLGTAGDVPASTADPATPETGEGITTASSSAETSGEEEPTQGSVETPAEEEPPPLAPPSGPVLLGAGQFVGLAGHSGTGDAGLFQNPDGSFVLRFENFDIQNGPDLEVYLVPGADQVSLAEGSIHLGPLKGNIGDQNYEVPADTELIPGSYTALVWCEAFSVEFVGATIDI